MSRQSALDLAGLTSGAMQDQTTLRTGQVACPFAPNADEAKFESYVQLCLATWSVDVVLDDGQYISGCRIIVPSGNLREGFRRMLKFPKLDFSSRYWVGDKVVVGFLNGTVARPVILGALFPVPLHPDPTKTLEELAESQFVITDHDEWADRHEVVDYTTEANPLASFTDTRDTASDVTYSHVVQSETTAGKPEDNVEARVLSSDAAASTLTTEHAVESGNAQQRTTNIVQFSDEEATDLRFRHTVEQRSGSDVLASSMSLADIGAKLIELQHVVEMQAGVINQLTMRSTNGRQLVLQHAAQGHTVQIESDDIGNRLAFARTNKATSSNASISIEEHNNILIRRRNSGEADSWIKLNANGTIGASTPNGTQINLTDTQLSAKTASGVSVVLDQAGGVTISNTKGESISMAGTQITVSAASVLVKATSVGLATGVMSIGAGASNDGSGGTHQIPAADVLYPKLKATEERLASLESAFVTHSHTGNNVPPTATGVAVGSRSSYVDSRVDSLKSLKAD
jgi:hypothetical protein